MTFLNVPTPPSSKIAFLSTWNTENSQVICHITKEWYIYQNIKYVHLYSKLSYACILIGSHLWSIGGQTYRWCHHFNSLLYKTNRSQVAVRLFSNRSQRTSKCGKNTSDTLAYISCATFLFLPHFDILCDLLLNRCTATWNLFVKYHKAWVTYQTILIPFHSFHLLIGW